MSYQPENPPSDAKDLAGYVYRELQRVADSFSFNIGHAVEVRSVEPSKPREWMVVGADGSNWNPGSGKGVYVYYSSAWHFLG